MYEFWYNYTKPKFQQNANSFIVHIKTKDFYEDIVDNVEKWSDTSKMIKDCFQ